MIFSVHPLIKFFVRKTMRRKILENFPNITQDFFFNMIPNGADIFDSFGDIYFFLYPIAVFFEKPYCFFAPLSEEKCPKEKSKKNLK